VTFETATTRDLDLADLVGRALGPAAAGRVFAEAPADREVIPAARFLEPDALRTAILRAAGGAGIDDDALDLRPSAARWTRQYAAAILPAILAPLAAGVALDASIERCTIVMNGHLPGGLHLDDPAGGALFWPERVGAVWEHGRLAASLDDLRAHAFRTLFTQHLVPLFDQVLAQAKLSSDVLWSNVAEHATLIYDSARSHLTPPPQALDEDDALLMKGASLPGLAGPNPLRGWIVREPVDQPDFPQPLLLRRVCSLHYLLPDRIGRFCSDCPLISKEERIAQARIARGAPSGAASATLTRGPAVATSAGMPGVGEPAPRLP